MPCVLIDSYECFEGSSCLSLHCQRIILPPWRRKSQVLLKHLCMSTKLHGIASQQKTINLIILTTVTTSNLIKPIHVEIEQWEVSGVCILHRSWGFFRDLNEMSGIRWWIDLGILGTHALVSIVPMLSELFIYLVLEWYSGPFQHNL
jgi:hypothetical protein